MRDSIDQIYTQKTCVLPNYYVASLTKACVYIRNIFFETVCYVACYVIQAALEFTDL